MRPATQQECDEIVGRIAELELRESNTSDPGDVAKEVQETKKAFQDKTKRECVGKRITQKALTCVRSAKTAEEIVHECLNCSDAQRERRSRPSSSRFSARPRAHAPLTDDECLRLLDRYTALLTQEREPGDPSRASGARASATREPSPRKDPRFRVLVVLGEGVSDELRVRDERAQRRRDGALPGVLMAGGERFFLAASGASGALAVMLGAFGAHGLRSYLAAFPDGADRRAFWETAAHYHLVHAVVLAIAGLLAGKSGGFGARRARGLAHDRGHGAVQRQPVRDDADGRARARRHHPARRPRVHRGVGAPRGRCVAASVSSADHGDPNRPETLTVAPIGFLRTPLCRPGERAAATRRGPRRAWDHRARRRRAVRTRARRSGEILADLGALLVSPERHLELEGAPTAERASGVACSRRARRIGRIRSE